MRLLIVGDIISEIKKAIDLAQARKVQVMLVGNVEAAFDFVREIIFQPQ